MDLSHPKIDVPLHRRTQASHGHVQLPIQYLLRMVARYRIHSVPSVQQRFLIGMNIDPNSSNVTLIYLP